MSWLPENWLAEGWLPEGWLPGEGGSPSQPGPVYVPTHRTVRAGLTFTPPAGKDLMWPSPKSPGEPSRYRLDFTREVEIRWERRRFIVGERVSAGGFDAVATKGGLPGWSEPPWPNQMGAVVVDGSMEWTLAAASSASLIALDADTPVEWVAPGGITVQEPKFGPISTSAVLLGGEPGSLVTVVVKVRYASGEGFDQPCVLRVV